MDCSSTINAQAHSLLRTSTENHEDGYTRSLASSPTSSTSSIFSLDAPSSQSSVSSTSSSWDSDNDSAYSVNQVVPQQHNVYTAITAIEESKARIVHIDPVKAVASESRQHPRRTQAPTQIDGPLANTVPRPPPSLVRQSERKDNFVESLVGELRLVQKR